MKKLVLLFLAGIAFWGMAKAQGGYSFGPKVGLSITNISHSGGDSKLSVHVGAFGEVRFNDWMGLQTEVLYSRQGWRDKVEIGGSDEKVKFRVNYFNIPVMARLYVFDALSVDLGPQLDIALNARARYKHSGDIYKDKMHGLNTLGVSFVFGLSYDLYERVLISARYNLGLSNAFDKDKFDDDNKNHVFQISLGYKLSW